MRDIHVPKLVEQPWQVSGFGGDGAQVLDATGVSQRSRWNRIDRDQPSVDFVISLPRLQQAVGLHGLTA